MLCMLDGVVDLRPREVAFHGLELSLPLELLHLDEGLTQPLSAVARAGHEGRGQPDWLGQVFLGRPFAAQTSSWDHLDFHVFC